MSRSRQLTSTRFLGLNRISLVLQLPSYVTKEGIFVTDVINIDFCFIFYSFLDFYMYLYSFVRVGN